MKQQMPLLGVWLGKAQSWLLGVMVLFTLAAPALIHLAGQASDPSQLDNRPTPRFPELPTSISAIEKFRDGVNKFIDTNFGLRAELVKLNFLIYSWLGQSSVPGLMKGKDNWFFLKSDFAILDQFRGINRFTDAELDDWIDTMEAYREWLALRGIAFVVLIAPNQQTIYADKMPGYANRARAETRLDQVVRRLRERQSRLIFVDPREDLWAERAKQQLYRKYEGHWNELGALVAYSALMRPIARLFPGVETLKLSDFTIIPRRIRWQMPPFAEDDWILDIKGSSRVVSRETIPTNTGPVSTTSSTLDKAPTVLIFGDSFAEEKLLELMNETFRSISFVSSNHLSFPKEVVDQQRPDVMIYEIVERYLARPLGDNQAINAELLMKKAPSLQELLGKNKGLGGVIDGVVLEKDSMNLPGWAVDVEGKAPAKEIFAYEGEQLIGAAKPVVLRPDITRGMSDHNAGFNLHVRLGAGNAARGPIRIFARNADRVYEVRLSPAQLQQIETLRR